MKLCVLIPGKDERLGMPKTLRSVLAAGVDPADVYVVDDGSEDETSGIALGFGVNVLRNEKNVGKAGAIARGAEHFELLTRYDVIALMDADTAVCPGYYDAVRESLKDESIVAVCGRPKSLPYNWLTAYRCYSYYMTHTVYRAGQTAMGVITVAPGCSTSFRTSAFKDMQWTTDTIVEDMDCTIQIHKKGLGKITYQPKAVVYTQDPKSLKDYIKQTNRWYTGAWQVGQKHGMMRGRGDKIDWEYRLLLGEALIFGIALTLLPVWIYLIPRKVEMFVLLNSLLLILSSFLAAYDTKRFDVILFSPVFVFLQTLDLFILLRTFAKTVVLSRHDHAWNHCARY